MYHILFHSAYLVARATVLCHTQLTKMGFDEILDLKEPEVSNAIFVKSNKNNIGVAGLVTD